MRRNYRIVLAFANTTSLLLTIIMNYLANTLPLNSISTGEVSKIYDNLFVPAGFTFIIWGLVYLLLAVFVVYQLIEAFRIQKGRPFENFIDKIGFWFIVSSTANISWLFAWHFQIIWLSLVIMLALLGSLLVIYIRLQIDVVSASALERYLVKFPFSVYLGWITVATIANASALITAITIESPLTNELQQSFAIFVIAAAVGIAAFMLLRRNDYPYALVIAWGLGGIFYKRFFDSSEHHVADLGVEIAAAIGVLLILSGVVWYFLFKRQT